jgi:hypothetical protein
MRGGNYSSATPVTKISTMTVSPEMENIALRALVAKDLASSFSEQRDDDREVHCRSK